MRPVFAGVRKVIRIGERSVGITIPKEWLSILGIDLGSSVEIALGPGYLLIKPLSTAYARKMQTIKIKHDDPEVLSRLIIASYIEGFDTVVVEDGKDIARAAFQKTSMRLPGAIALEGPTYRIKISVDEFNTDLNDVINSMKSILLMMFDLIIDYFGSGDKHKLEEILRLDDDLDRLHFLGIRTIKRTAFRDPSQAIDSSIVIKSLEHIGDTLDRASNTLIKIAGDTIISKDICRSIFKDIFSKVSSYISKAINALTSQNLALSMKVLIGREELAKEIMSSVTPCLDAPGVLGLVHEAIVAVYEAAEIAEVATNRVLLSIGKTEPVVVPKPETAEEFHEESEETQ